MDTSQQTNPDAFKALILSKYPNGVSSDGTPYSQMDATALTQKVVSAYPDGVTASGQKYSDFLPAQNTSGVLFPASPSDGPVAAGLKAAGNTLPDAWNFLKGVVTSPVTAIQNLA